MTEPTISGQALAIISVRFRLDFVAKSDKIQFAAEKNSNMAEFWLGVFVA